MYDPDKNGIAPTGWVCPLCGRALSPWTSFCPCAEFGRIRYTTGTGTYIFDMDYVNVSAQDGDDDREVQE